MSQLCFPLAIGLSEVRYEGECCVGPDVVNVERRTVSVKCLGKALCDVVRQAKSASSVSLETPFLKTIKAL